jgi:hypothetical protein
MTEDYKYMTYNNGMNACTKEFKKCVTIYIVNI